MTQAPDEVSQPEPAPAGANGRGTGSSAYVVPFAVFLVLLGTAQYLAFLGVWEYVLRPIILTATLFVFSRKVIDFRVRQILPTVALGIAVFVIWIMPDLLFPNYRSHFLFQNALTGTLTSSLAGNQRVDSAVLALRMLRAVILVPIIEELFWRAWTMRYIITPHFQTVPLGTYTFASMAITAALFASEHGPYWDVGLAAGLLYNWWMIRTKSLGDCILAHAVTNTCLSVYVVATGAWEYWL